MDTQYLKKVGIYVLSAILSIGIVFYFGYHIWHSFTKEIETEPAVKTSYEQTVVSEGYVFRTETLLDGTGDARSVIPTVLEGEHIRKGGQVAKMYSGFSPDTVSKVAEIESKIKLLERYGDTGSVSLKDTASIDREIYSVLSDIRGMADSGDLGGAASKRGQLVSCVGERAVLTGTGGEIKSEVSDLEKQKKELVSQLGSQLGTVNTPVSGYYYSETDGYEEVFLADSLADINLKDLRDLLKSEPGRMGTVGKTVTKSRWYLVCMIDESEKNTYKKGYGCTVKFKDSQLSVNMDVENVLHDKEGAALILSTNLMPEGFDFGRKQDVELVKQEYSGLKVPVSAVRLVNGETGVYILDVSVVSFRKVEILYTVDNYYVVKIPDSAVLEDEETEGEEESDKPKETPSLRLHDSIIVEGKGLYEGRVIGD